MKPSATKSGANWLPVIRHDTGHREVLRGDPLATRATALKYARLEIHVRIQKARI